MGIRRKIKKWGEKSIENEVEPCFGVIGKQKTTKDEIGFNWREK